MGTNENKLIENFKNCTETDPEATFINLPEADFESALKAAAKPQYNTLSAEKNVCHEDSSVAERLAFQLKKKAYAEGQKADENFSNINYSDVRFDAKKLKKSASHESYKPFMSRKSPSNCTSVHVDAAVNFPLIKKKSSLNESFGKNERSYSENEPIFENSSDFSTNFNDDRTFIIDETVPNYDEKSSKLRRVTKEIDEKLVSISNYGSIDDSSGKFSSLSNRENDSEDLEMVEMHDLSKKAVFGRNFGSKNDETDPLVDRTYGKRRSTSQRSGRSQEYNLAPSPFARYSVQSSGLLLSELNPGGVSTRAQGYDFSSSPFGRFSSPPPNTPHNRRGLKQNRRNKRSDDDGNVCKAEDINGFRGSDSLDSLLVYIEGAEAKKKLNSAVDDSSSTFVGVNKKGRKKEVKKEKAKKASSIGASCDNDDDDDLTSGSLEKTKFLCKSDDNMTKFNDDYIFCDSKTFVADDERTKKYVADVNEAAAATQFAILDYVADEQYMPVDEQFIPVMSKNKKKHRQNDSIDDGRRRVSAKRSITPPLRQKLNDKTAVGRRKRRNSYDSSPVNVDHSAMRRETGQKNVERDPNPAPGDVEPSTSSNDEKTDDVPTKLSYAIVVQRRPHSPTALSESSNEHSLSSTKLPSSRRQATSLNASRSNSPSYRTTSASATNQVNASSPDLKLFTDLPPLPSSSFAPTPIAITVSPGVVRTSYATVVTSKASPNLSTTAKNFPDNVPHDDTPNVTATSSTIESSLIEEPEHHTPQQQPSTSSFTIEANRSFDVVVDNQFVCDDKSPSSTTTSQRRYSCPPMRSHVEFLDKPGRTGDSAVPVIEGLTFGFEEEAEQQNLSSAENVSNFCDNIISSTNFVAADVVDASSSSSADVVVVDIVQNFAKDLTSPSDVMLKTMVNYVNKKWNDFVRTPDIVYYEK